MVQPTLAELVAQVRWPRNPKALSLEPHRGELLRLRQAGESVAAIRTGLRGLGIEISDEALRLWLNRELGHKSVRRRRPRATPVASDRNGELPLVGGTGTPIQSVPIADVAVTAESETRLSVAHTPVPQGTSLIRPGETPWAAMQRRLAALGAEQAAAKAAGLEQPGSHIARKDI
jgi:hypothetical protein